MTGLSDDELKALLNGTSSFPSGEGADEPGRVSLPPHEYIQSQSLKRHDGVAEEFSNMLKNYVVNMNGIRMTSFADFRSHSIQFPVKRIIVAFMQLHAQNYAARRNAAGKPKLRGHMEKLSKVFCVEWKRHTGFSVTDQDKKTAKNEALEAAAHFKISAEPKPRSVFSGETVRGIQRSVWFKTFSATRQRRLNLILFLACVVGTAALPGTFLRPSMGTIRLSDLARLDTAREWLQARTEIKRCLKGATFGQFILHVVRPSPGSAVNNVIGFYRASWSQSKLDRGPVFILLSGLAVADSPCILLLVSLVLKGVITAQSFADIFKVEFLGGRQSRRLRLPQECLSTAAMITSRGSSVSTAQMTKDLARLSLLCGFEESVTAFSFRQPGTKALRRRPQGTTIAGLCHVIGTAPGTAEMPHYERQVTPFSAATGERMSIQGLASSVTPHGPTPVSLTEEEEQEVQAEVELQMVEMEKSGKTGDKNSLRKTASKRKLDQVREEYFTGVTSSKKPRPSTTLAHSMQEMGPIEEAWYVALSQPPSAPLTSLIDCLKACTLSTSSSSNEPGFSGEYEDEEESDDDVDVSLVEEMGIGNGDHDYGWDSSEDELFDSADMVDSDAELDFTDLDVHSDSDYQL